MALKACPSSLSSALASYYFSGIAFYFTSLLLTSYYQPLTELSVPLHKNLYWNTEWQYYGYGEQAYVFEAFRTHIFQTGLRVTR